MHIIERHVLKLIESEHLDNETLSRMPALWYDVFVRLIPGSIFVSVLLNHYDSLPEISNLGEAAWILFVGYVVGHFIQPLAELFQKHLVFDVFASGLRMALKAERDATNVDKVRYSVLSKQRAESQGYVATALLLLVFVIIASFDDDKSMISSTRTSLSFPDIPLGVYWASIVVSLLFSIERSRRMLGYVTK